MGFTPYSSPLSSPRPTPSPTRRQPVERHRAGGVGPRLRLPGGNIQSAQVVQVSLSTWLSSAVYWGSSYQANYQGGVAQDPDPSVGPYTYDPSQNMNGHLWIGHYVSLRPDRPGDASVGVSPDWAFAQSGALITGQHGEVPAGYIGPTVPIQPPPAPTPTAVPTKTPTRVPTAVPTKAPTAVPTATHVATVTPVAIATSLPTEVVQPTATTIPLPTSTPVQVPAPPAIGDIPIAAWAALVAAPAVLGLLLVFLVWLRRRRRRRAALASGAARPDGPTTIHLQIPLPGETADSESASSEREAVLVDAAPPSGRATSLSQPGGADQV